MSQNAFILLIVSLIVLILLLLIIAHRQLRSRFEEKRKRKLISQMIMQPLQARPLDFYSDPYLRQLLYKYPSSDSQSDKTPETEE